MNIELGIPRAGMAFPYSLVLSHTYSTFTNTHTHTYANTHIYCQYSSVPFLNAEDDFPPLLSRVLMKRGFV